MKNELRLGQYIKQKREKKKLSLSELAKRSGVDQGYLSRIEKGEKTNPSANVLAKIADGLNVKRKLVFYVAGYINDDEDKELDLKEALVDHSTKAHWDGYPLTDEERKMIQRVIQAVLIRESNDQD
jgi:transcriptional regulator with XRE-family HTH domain